MKKLLVLLLALTFLAACAAPAAPVAPADPTPAPETAGADAQAPAPTPADNTPAADDAAQVPMQTEITFVASSTLAPFIASIADDFIAEHGTWSNVDASFPDQPILIHVSTGGSGQGVRSIVEQTADFGMVTRAIRDSEREEIPELVEFLVGADALTVSVSSNNPLGQLTTDLSSEQIINIFSGEYQTWQDVDPSLSSDDIVVIVRDAGGSAVEIFQDNMMGDVEVRIDAIQAPSMGALATSVVENANAISYPALGVVEQNADNLIAFSIDGIAPTVENILSGSYAIQRPMIIITSGDLDATAQAFVDVIMGEAGQSRLAEMGYIPAN